MYLNLIVLTLSILSLAHAAPAEIAVKKFVQDKHFKGTDVTLSISEDRNLPFSEAKLFRVRPMRGEGGWTVLVDGAGGTREVDKTTLAAFLKSLEKGLAKVKLSEDKSEPVKISNGLLNHLSTARRNVTCSEGKDVRNCELSFTEGNFAGQKASLIFDVKSGIVKVK